ncbi:hypothetical protein HZB04_00745 [Candidatus Wolfebacteria bacterium]|nr:hypothetical protein [Candidatus Wolfebacteria bacterium]
MNHHLHHLHQRKRIYQKLEEYPHPNRKIRLLDNIIILIAIFGPLANVIQIIKIFIEKNASGLSFFSWSAYALFNFIWIIYGLAHKEKPIFISGSLWLLTNIIILTEIILY